MEARADIGVVVFDADHAAHPRETLSGFRCQARREPIRVCDTEELPSNITWLTNLAIDARALHKDTGRTLLNSRYLGVPVDDVLQELGAGDAAPSDKAYLLARVFSNVLTQARAIFHVKDTGDIALSSQIAICLGRASAELSDDVSAASLLATHANQRTSLPSQDNATTVRTRLPRVSHAAKVLAHGIPIGPYVEVEKRMMPTRAKRREWLLSLERPFLAAINVSKVAKPFRLLMEERLGTAASMRVASSFTRLESGSATVVPSNELRVIDQFCDYSIERVFAGEKVERGFRLPTDSRIARCSYSFGLISEAFWGALCRDSAGSYRRTPQSAWIHAADRMECLKAAISLQSKGFGVSAFGGGTIDVQVPPEKKGEFAAYCEELGLCLPMGFTGFQRLAKSVKGHEAPDFLYRCGDLSLVLEFDDRFTTHCCKEH